MTQCATHCETQCDKVCAQEENSFNWWQILTSAGNYLQIERITKKNTKITLKRITKHTFVLKSSIHWESYPELSTKDETEIWKIIHNALHCNGDCLTNLKIALHSCNVFFFFTRMWCVQCSYVLSFMFFCHMAYETVLEWSIAWKQLVKETRGRWVWSMFGL